MMLNYSFNVDKIVKSYTIDNHETKPNILIFVLSMFYVFIFENLIL